MQIYNLEKQASKLIEGLVKDLCSQMILQEKTQRQHLDNSVKRNYQDKEGETVSV